MYAVARPTKELLALFEKQNNLNQPRKTRTEIRFLTEH